MMAEWPTHKNMMMLLASKVNRTPALTNKADEVVDEDVAVVVKDLLVADVKADVDVAVTMRSSAGIQTSGGQCPQPGWWK
jgi:hypothetical protein